MIATDPLSLVFLTCALFSGVFLLVTTLLGGGHSGAHAGAHSGAHSGGLHLGGHDLHAPHLGAHASHAGASHATSAHATTGAHANASSAKGGATSTTADASFASPLQTLGDLLLGALSLYGVLMFLLVFGVLGYLLHNGAGSLSLILLLLIPALVGVVCAVGVSALLTRLFVATQAGELTAESSHLEGRIGTVSMAIRPGGIGEIIFEGATGARQSVGARCIDGGAIPVGSEVVILNYENGVAQAQSWDTFMASLGTGDAHELQPLDTGVFPPKQLP